MRSANQLVAIAIVAAYLLAGIVGHDPWKQDEAYTFGIVLHILETGDWVVPTLAGEPFMEKPPLYYLTAAATARLASPWLPLHDGARLASVLYVGLAIACTALAARKLFGPGRGTVAALLLAGCLGLAPQAHELITDTALFAGFAIALWGLAWALDRPMFAGIATGTGVGIGFMSKGLVEPAMVGLAMTVLPVLFKPWRNHAYARAAAWTFFAALPWLVAWPAALLARSDSLFTTWFWVNNLGRYFGFANLGADSEAWYYTRVVPWFTLPVLPLAIWHVWRARRNLLSSPAIQLCVVFACSIIAILATSATARSLYLVPMLVPLAALASHSPEGGLRRAGWVASTGLAAIAAAVVWLAWWIWIAAMFTGKAPHIGPLASRLPYSFRFEFHPVAFAVALALTLGWFLVWTNARRLSWPHAWAANVAVAWGVVMTLMLPWIDSAKSFREPFTGLARNIAPNDCVSSMGLGEPQRGMLHYYTGMKTLRVEHDGVVCPLHLLQSDHAGHFPALPYGEWTLVWAGARRGETVERFRLYAGEPHDAKFASP
jgi:4-amino-4-deoxy-L-arabinose transferase-like glycosyltransferase